MTGEQKQRILQLRSKGKTYAAIAEVLGLSQSAVKSFFSRSGAHAVAPDERGAVEPDKCSAVVSDAGQGEIVAPAAGVCRQCGSDLKLHAGNRMKRFCSESCRQKWWRTHPGFITDKASASTCVGCGVVFKNGGNPARRYCSRACYVKHRFGDGAKEGARYADGANDDTNSGARYESGADDDQTTARTITRPTARDTKAG